MNAKNMNVNHKKKCSSIDEVVHMLLFDTNAIYP